MASRRAWRHAAYDLLRSFISDPKITNVATTTAVKASSARISCALGDKPGLDTSIAAILHPILGYPQGTGMEIYAVDAAQQMVRRNVIVEVEGIRQPVLVAAVVTHHRDALRVLSCKM